jgi:inorganic pyrophosphatase
MVRESFEVFIEMPKGDDRRRHLSYDKKKMLDLGPTKEVIPVNGGMMPIAYGFVTGTLQTDEATKHPNEVPDEVDVLVYSKKSFKVGETVQDVTAIALITRADGDHKVVGVDSTTRNQIKRWEDISAKERELILYYFGYKFPITKVEGADTAIDYIKQNKEGQNKNSKQPE